MKKLISLLLAIVMMLGVVALTACDKTPATDDTKAPAADDTKAPADNDEPEETEAPKELTTITMLVKSNNNNAKSAYRYKDNKDWAGIPLIQRFYDNLAEVGVKIEYEVIDDEQYGDAVKTRLLTGVDLPDIICNPGLSETEEANAGEAGILMDINALLAEYDEDGSAKAFMSEVSGAWLAAYTDEQGRMWGFPYIYQCGWVDGQTGEQIPGIWFETCSSISIREDWLEAIGEEYKMYYTPEEFSDIVIKMYENDANGNGTKDEVISNLNTNFYTGFEYAFDMPYGLFNIRNNGKGVECALDAEGLGDYVAFMKKLYDGGAIDTTTLNGTNVKAANRASVYYGYTSQTWEEAAIVGYETTACYSPIIIDDDEGVNGFGVGWADGAQNVYGKTYVNAQSENLEAVAKFLDVFYTQETSDLINWGDEGVHSWYDENGVRKSVLYQQTEAIERGLSVYDEETNPDYNAMTMRVLTSMGLVNIFYITKPIELAHPTGSANPMYQHKYDMNYYHLQNWDKITGQTGGMPLACATSAELETMASLSNTIDTYVSELMLALFMGEKTMDDVPAAITELESLGLRDLQAVYEARFDRFMAVAAESGADTMYD